MDKPLKPAQATVQVDNDRLKVTLWRFAPGTHTGWHRHGMDYVVVPLTDGALTIDDGKQRTVVAMQAAASYSRQLGVEHDVINASDRDFAFVEIELK